MQFSLNSVWKIIQILRKNFNIEQNSKRPAEKFMQNELKFITICHIDIQQI